MARYVVQHRYRSFSDGQHWGPWTKSVVVDLDEARAEWVNRDVPGTLIPEPEAEAEAEPEAPEDAPEAPEAAEADKPRNRKHTPARARS